MGVEQGDKRFPLSNEEMDEVMRKARLESQAREQYVKMPLVGRFTKEADDGILDLAAKLFGFAR